MSVLNRFQTEIKTFFETEHKRIANEIRELVKSKDKVDWDSRMEKLHKDLNDFRKNLEIIALSASYDEGDMLLQTVISE